VNRAEKRASRGYVVTGNKASFGGWENRDQTLSSPLAPPGIVRAWVNNKYSVQVFLAQCAWGEVTLLMIKRHDGAAVTQWYELQRIKNEIVGPERTAVQVFPAVSELMDSANLYHLWVLPVGVKLPFGLHLPEQWQDRPTQAPDAADAAVEGAQ
jgi:hypothetical protein